ncbi:MAG TPA: hypothetical protein VEH04_01685 [Verrucomicrobiae bacterium]|nr:hypothetical protein [Verrucomicrobiae bacterium]
MNELCSGAEWEPEKPPMELMVEALKTARDRRVTETFSNAVNQLSS